MTCPLDPVCGEGTEAHLEYFKYMFKSPCFCAHCFELVIMTAWYPSYLLNAGLTNYFDKNSHQLGYKFRHMFMGICFQLSKLACNLPNSRIAYIMTSDLPLKVHSFKPTTI